MLKYLVRGETVEGSIYASRFIAMILGDFNKLYLGSSKLKMVFSAVSQVIFQTVCSLSLKTIKGNCLLSRVNLLTGNRIFPNYSISMNAHLTEL